jgi:hypothetical protein
MGEYRNENKAKDSGKKENRAQPMTQRDSGLLFLKLRRLPTGVC